MSPSPGSTARPLLEPLQPPLEERPKLPRLLPGTASRRGPHMQGAARGTRWSAATALGSACVRLQRAVRRGAGRGGARRAGRGEDERGQARGAGPTGHGGRRGRRAGESGSVRTSPPLAARDSPPRVRWLDPLTSPARQVRWRERSDTCGMKGGQEGRGRGRRAGRGGAGWGWGGGRELERGGGAGRGDWGGRERVGGRAELNRAGEQGGASSAAAETGRTARISRQVEDRGGTSRAFLEARLRPVQGTEAILPVAFSGVHAQDLRLEYAHQKRGDSGRMRTD